MTAVYRWLLKLYPLPHRHKFSDEMLDAFIEAQAESKCKGMCERSAFYVRELLGLARGAVREQLHAVAVCRQEELSIGGNMFQRTEFGFPRSCIVMMTFILVIVIGMIAKIQGVSHFYGKAIVGELPHQPWQWPSYYGLISGIAECFLLAWIAGVIVWAIAYAMSRTAAQQLGKFEAWPQARP